MKKNPVVHFEMPAEDVRRMADFYSNVFGWEPEFYGEDMGNYVTVKTTETDGSGRPSAPGAINGGLFPKNQNMPSNCPSLVIAVDDINEHVKKVSAAGGNVLGEPQDIPNVGLYVSFRDTEGNICSLLQPSMQMESRTADVERGKETVPPDDEGLTGEI